MLQPTMTCRHRRKHRRLAAHSRSHRFAARTHALRTDCVIAAGRRRARLVSGRRLSGAGRGGPHPDWVAGISIGAINSAIIAGNAPERRVDRLRDFWETVSASPLGIPYFKSTELSDEVSHQFVNQVRAMGILLFGAPNFFVPRMPPALLWPGGRTEKASYYDNTPLSGDARAAGRFRPYQRWRHAL